MQSSSPARILPVREARTKQLLMNDQYRKYAIIVDGDSLEEAVEETAHLLYLLLGRALRAHRRDHSEGCAFDDFALETLAVLDRYRSVYSHAVLPEAPDPA